ALVCLVRDGRSWRVTGKRSSGKGGYSPGQVVYERRGELTAAQARRLEAHLGRAGFWGMPSGGRLCGCDGTWCLLEGVCGDRYHAVNRWGPRDSPFADLVRYMLRLAKVALPGPVG